MYQPAMSHTIVQSRSETSMKRCGWASKASSTESSPAMLLGSDRQPCVCGGARSLNERLTGAGCCEKLPPQRSVVERGQMQRRRLRAP